MPFPADSLGFRLKSHESDLSVRRVLAYAAGLGATSPVWLNDAKNGGLLAMPFQCVSPEWPVLVSLRQGLTDVLTPSEASRGVHAVQDSTFHRPLRAGMQLTTDGQLVVVRPIRAGVLTVCRLVTRDKADAEPVVTTWTSSIYRDVRLQGEAGAIAEPPALESVDTQPPGPGAVTTTIHIPRAMSHVYSECADIWNPIHTERLVALSAGLPDIILHGTASWALAGLTILGHYADDNAAALKRITGRFTGMIIPGEDITIRHDRSPTDAIRFEVRNGAGAPAISQGIVWLH